MTSVHSDLQISWLFRDFKPEAESWKELTNSYFFQLFPISPITIIEITTGPSGQQMIFLFSQVSISAGGGKNTHTIQIKQKKHNQKRVLNRFVILLSF